MTGPRSPATDDPAPGASLFRRFLPAFAHRTTGEILAHPGYARMRRNYVASATASVEIANFPGGLQSAAYRVAAIGALVCLHAAHDPEDRATWPTLARFKQAVAVIGLSSPRQLDDLVARLVRTEHVVLERLPADGRLRLLRPTEKLLAWDRAMLCGYYDSLQMLYPDPGYACATGRDPAFHLAQRRVSVRIFDVIARFLAENTAILPMHGAYNGVLALMMLADFAADARSVPIRESNLSGLRTRFGVSRSHIRNILTSAEAHGLVIRSGTGKRTIAMTSLGLAAIDRFIADTLASHDLTYRMALEEMARAGTAHPRDRDGAEAGSSEGRRFDPGG